MVQQTGHRTVRFAFLAVVFLLLSMREARAQGGVGFQGGASIDPEQVYFGAHFETGPLVDRLHLRPSIDGGFGQGYKLASINVEFIYAFPILGSEWTLYQGSGPAVHIFRFGDETEVRGGLVATFGGMHDNGLFFEVKVGAINGANLKFGIGYTVRSRPKSP